MLSSDIASLLGDKVILKSTNMTLHYVQWQPAKTTNAKWLQCKKQIFNL